MDLTEDAVTSAWSKVHPVYMARVAATILNHILNENYEVIKGFLFTTFELSPPLLEVVGDYAIRADEQSSTSYWSALTLLNLLCTPYDHYLTAGMPISVIASENKIRGFTATADLPWDATIIDDPGFVGSFGKFVGTSIQKSRFYPGWDPDNSVEPPDDKNAVARVISMGLNAFSMTDGAGVREVLFRTYNPGRVQLFKILSSMCGTFDRDNQSYCRLAGTSNKTTPAVLTMFGITEELMDKFPGVAVRSTAFGPKQSNKA